MSRKTWTTIALIAALALVVGVSFVVGGLSNPDGRFEGTDSAATRTIEEGNPDYVVWFQPFFLPESEEVESGLFALQAGLGGSVLGFALGALWQRRRGDRARAAAEPPTNPSSPDEPTT